MTVAISKPGFDADGNRNLKIKPGDSCLILRPINDGFQTIVFHNFPAGYDEDDKLLYHVMMRGLAELAVESTQEVVNIGLESARATPGGVRPVDAEGNIIEGATQPDGAIDLSTILPAGKA